MFVPDAEVIRLLSRYQRPDELEFNQVIFISKVIDNSTVWIGNQAYKNAGIPGVLEHDREAECPPSGDCAI